MSRALLLAISATLLLAAACSSPPPPDGGHVFARQSVRTTPMASMGAKVARIAQAQVGAPYRYGGRGPSGFDCSGLVVYAYEQVGVEGLPRSARDLQRAARRVSMDELQPGDLLFFQLSGRKTSHVGIYLGDRRFVHAPSKGKRVEVVSFDHVYWGRQLGMAGRLSH